MNLNIYLNASTASCSFFPMTAESLLCNHPLWLGSFFIHFCLCLLLYFFLFSTELWKRNYKQSWVPFKANSNSSHWMNKRAVSENNSMAFLPSWLVSCSDDETVHLIHWRGSEEINCQFSVNFWFWQLEEWTSEIDSCNCTPQEAFRVNKQLFFHKSQLYFVKKLQANNYLVRNPPAIASQSSAPACNVTPSFCEFRRDMIQKIAIKNSCHSHYLLLKSARVIESNYSWFVAQ